MLGSRGGYGMQVRTELSLSGHATTLSRRGLGRRLVGVGWVDMGGVCGVYVAVQSAPRVTTGGG